MKNKYKAASSVGAVALLLSGAAIAVMDATVMDQWSVTSGTIDAACDSSWELCTGAIVDNGFYQRTIEDDGITYFQTIITEYDATDNGSLDSLVFSDESFVRTGNVSGILDKQRISDDTLNNGPGTSTLTHFRAATNLSSGWAGDALKIYQFLLDDEDQFQTDFFFEQHGTSANPTGRQMKVTAYVPIEQGDDQDFVLVTKEGSFNSGAGSVTLPWQMGGGVSTMAWSAGDSIQGIWVGQNLTAIVGQEFGFNSYDNKSTATNDYIARFSLTDMDAKNWDTNVWGTLETQGSVSWP